MSYTKQVISGSIYFFVGSVLAAIIAYVTKLVLVRNLSVEDYGLFFAVLTFVLMFSVFRTLGLSQGLARFIADYNVKKKHGEIKSIITGAFVIQLIVAGVMVLIFWLLADFLALNYFNDSRASYLLKLLSLYFPLSIVFVNFNSIFQGLKKSKIFALSQSALNLLVLLGVVAGMYFGMGIYAPVLGYLGSFVFFFLIFIFPLLKGFNYFKFKHKHFFSENKNLMLFSLPLVLTSVGALIITYFDTLMLTYFDSLASVGVYNIIYPTAILITMIGTSLGAILLPVATELWSLKKKTEIVGAFKIMYKYLLILSLPMVLVLVTFSNELIRIFFGSDYLVGVLAFNILIIGALFYIFMIINNNLLIAFKDSKNTMRIYVFGAILNIVLNIFLIPRYSLSGAAIASAISFFAMFVLSLNFVSKKIKIKTPWKSLFISVLLSVIIPLTPLISNKLFSINIYVNTLVGLIVGCLIYIFALYKLRVLDFDELKKILKQ